MYVYSGYHDRFFEIPGSAREATKSWETLVSIVNRFIPLDEIVDLYFGAEVEIEGVYAIEVWIVLENGTTTNLILADSPIPLNLEQWQILVNKLSEGYKPYQLA